MRLGQLHRELVRECRLPGVPGAEQRDVCLALQVRATSCANGSIPTIFDGSSSGRSQMNGFSAMCSLLYRLSGTILYRLYGTIHRSSIADGPAR